MDEDEKEEILHRLDEKTDSLHENQKEIRDDVRTNREVYNDRLNKTDNRLDKVDDTATSNKVRIAGLAFGITLLLSIAVRNMGWIPV